MCRTLTALALGLACAGPTAAGDWAVTIPYLDHDSIVAGEQIYGKFCAGCHGAILEGQPNWRLRGEDGYLPAPPHDASGHTWQHGDTQLYLIVKHGIETLMGGTYKSRMNGFGHLLSDEEILQTLAYIKSTWPDHIVQTHNDIRFDMVHGRD